MASLFVTLRNSAASMRVFERGITVVQSNVTNVNTPGYARQRQILVADASDLEGGLAGSVASGGTLSSRSAFAEQSVRRSLHSLGYAAELSSQLSRLEPVFDVAEGSGVAASMQQLFDAFSALSVAPNDSAARQLVLQSARNLAGSFQHMSYGISSGLAEAGYSFTNETERINQTLAQIKEINHRFKMDARAQSDPGLDAQLNTLLESLAESMDFTVLRSEDGSVNISAGGQAPVLIGEHLYPLTADLSGGQARLLDHEGNDILPKISSGRIAAQAELYNKTIPSYAADLDLLASTLADAVNSQLAQGVDLSGAAPATGLFTYDAALGAARTIQVTSMAADQIAAASVGAPGGSGNAEKLAALAGQNLIDGGTFIAYYGSLTAKAGRDLVNATSNAAIQSSLSTQVRQIRDDMSRVNLDEEAIALLEFQRAYEAAAKMVATLDEMTETVLNMI
jgi:flagellar hook-associated protein 1 FlgK